MENSDKLVRTDEIKSLREAIKNKYNEYHSLDRDRFPDFEYNTNRANYEPLRASFNEAFFLAPNRDWDNSTIHIPSTNTLALLFTDDTYVPGRKIVHTCRLYATGSENAHVRTDASIATQPENPTSAKPGRIILLSGLFSIVTGFAVYTVSTRLNTKPTAGGLTVTRPYQGQTVPRRLQIDGKVAHADIVWIVVRPVKQGEKCYVQNPIKVEEDGTWKGKIYIGSPGKSSIGLAFQIRAFVNPEGIYETMEEGKYVFDSWPEKAELSTEAVVVIRGATND